MILVFKEFLQINFTTDFCTLCKRVSRFSLQKFSFHSVEKFRQRTLLCFRKFLLSKNVRDKRGGGYHDFPSKTFCLTVPKIFVGETFSVSFISGIEKIYAYEGKITIFQLKICCLTAPKNFVGEPFCVSQNFWYRKNLWIRGRGEEGEEEREEGGSIMIFCQKFFVSQCRKIS